jgi:ABC-type lipoprotein export system ATPase subunit
LSYAASFQYDDPAEAVRLYPMLTNIITIVPSIVAFAIDAGDDNYRPGQPSSASDTFADIFSIFPTFGIQRSVAKIMRMPSGDIGLAGVFSWESRVPLTIILNLVGAVVFLCIALHFENRSGSHADTEKKKESETGEEAVPVEQESEESDVKEERARATKALHAMGEGAESEATGIVAHNLTKQFGDKFAVKNLSFQVPQGELFVLLGPNGAGKTTAMSMLHGEVDAGGGSAHTLGLDVAADREELVAKSQVGLCPQVDAHDPLLTVREHLHVFCRFKGVSESLRGRVVATTIAQLGLEPFAETVSSKLSGGNRRTLSVGISLLGWPSAVFLDEPR